MSRGWRRLGTALGLALLTVYSLAPFYWMVVSSLRGEQDILSNAPLPAAPTLANYADVLGGNARFLLALRNSAVIASVTTLLALVMAVSAAYALARLRFRGKGLVLGTVLSAAMFPGISLVTPMFKLFSDWGLIDTYPALVVPDLSFALPLAVWVLTSFFIDLPWGLEEAAQIDGCSRPQAFRRVILPIAAPAVFTTTILVFITVWNEYLVASSMSLTSDASPVTVAIARLAGSSQFQQPFGQQMAAGVVVCVPIVLVVLLFQRRIIAGLTAGAVKG
ncbi:carbohydrate ABC transporter permease [Dactylosporangium sp. AC04546]|uniref:carbohydrate ABC transporter permease n=1 Tax=Dactylosporangium sp. AC04546 TaxID=2862460 RepID=UPI001EDDE879|nr:carbohydrate ABC transporter permease [Dactylosporangium sp. AC04546]WVK81189.1 carbohydrate ABC transporter permease [Dactylosporangium sp. AC04546]